MATEKQWDEMTFQELTRDALITHALSLGGDEALQALNYLEELDGKEIEYTAKMKADDKKKLQMKFKRERVKNPEYAPDNDKKQYIYMKTNERLYTDSEIEIMLLDKETVPMTIFAIKREYCKKYWQAMLPKSKKSEETFTDKIAAAKAKLKAASGSK